MTIEELKAKGLIVFESVSGSRAYGLHTPQSDTDIKGVFIMPKQEYYGWNYIPQLNNPTNDISYYELGQFLKFLSVNNPNIIELLNCPPDCILFKHPLMDLLKPELFLSKLCKDTFGKYALSQIKKAKGLKKKIVNPVDKERKTILSFCYVHYGQGAIPLKRFLEIKDWKQEDCGLANIPHMKNIYGLYHDSGQRYMGIMKTEASNDVVLSSIPKDTQPIAMLYFNKEGYSSYCKEYREYWDWVARRNEVRYQNTKDHGKNYDAKNMMHVFRLLQMAIEIGKDKQVNVKRHDRDFLLAIKKGRYSYDELLQMAQQRQEEMEEAFALSTLPEKPDVNLISKLAFQIRDAFYSEKFSTG